MKQPAPTRLSEQDLYLFNEGSHLRLYEKLGAHPGTRKGVAGTHFAVWAPNARSVSVIGDFNGWDRSRHPLQTRASSGIWEGFVPGVETGTFYKYHVVSRAGGFAVDKADPFAFHAEAPPRTASTVWSLDYEWMDKEWMESRGEGAHLGAPLSVYEVHLGSWRRGGEHGERRLGYREIAPLLAEYVSAMGFTHVEFLPVMEHPFYGSWGYQITGYFAPTARYGRPQDLMYLIDLLHQRGFGVVLDWVPSHFPTDDHGLARFDGTHLYEHADPRLGFHPDWHSAIFNYDRHEVRSFLLSSARFWLDRYHADGLRVDAVASMLYRDYSRPEGEWIPNVHGGRENLGAIGFLQELNRRLYHEHPDIFTVAEESTAFPGVSRPTDEGGLGFGFKWDMGWMNDTLGYVACDPVHRRWHHDELTFRMVYAFDENFVLPLSHDEVVHGKGSLLARLPGDPWQQRAGLRLLYGYQYGLPGKKLLFMGSELAMGEEWSHETELPWGLLADPDHAGVLDWVVRLNELYRSEPALHVVDGRPEGFHWVIADDAENSVLAFLRAAPDARPVLVVCNFTPVVRSDYRIGVPTAGRWQELANSDATAFGGGGMVNGEVVADHTSAHGHPSSISVTVPPLAACFFTPDG
jgi:1,4-alpha-glucan branching enzyme